VRIVAHAEGMMSRDDVGWCDRSTRAMTRDGKGKVFGVLCPIFTTEFRSF